MASKSKFFRIAVEGATTDGRVIDRQWVEDMAAQYNPNTYGARINIEHIKSYSPDSTFKAYGDVIALKTEEVEIFGAKKLALLAQIDATPELVALTKARQKIYTSCEVTPNFADSGKVYLTGLAVCDNPASLGTEMLAFSAGQGEKSPLASRKQHPGNHFSESLETTIEFSEDEPQGLLAKVKAMFTTAKADNDKDVIAKFTEVHQATELLASHAAKAEAEAQTATAAVAELTGKFTALSDEHTKTQENLAKLQEAMDNTAAHAPNGTQNHSRTPATGGDGLQTTDC